MVKKKKPQQNQSLQRNLSKTDRARFLKEYKYPEQNLIPITYFGNAHTFEFRSKKTGKIYIWRKQEDTGNPAVVLVDRRDVNDITSIKGRGQHSIPERRGFLFG